ncbi:MAG: PKD domain-containing protein [Bacteroidales bacterium]|nr:PKD domain-containing protein [Bacteroidales bacterium]
MKKLFTIILIILSIIDTVNSQSLPQENLQLWLRADSVEIIDGKVARWYDLSSNEHVIQQTNPEYRPIQIISELNSQPSIYFNGTNNYFDGGNILNIGYASQTMFVIAKSEKNRGSILSKTLTGPAANRYGLLFSDNISFFFWDNTERRIATDLIMNKFLYLNTIIDKQINKNFFNVNNDLIGEKTIVANHNMTSSYNFLIGASANNTGGLPPYNASYFQGEISEILIFDTVLSPENFNLVENYLFDKYTEKLDLGEDINIDYGFCDTSLTVSDSFTDILWSTGDTSKSIQVNKSGYYSVSAKDIFGRTQYDTVFVKFPSPNISNSNICLGDSILYSPILTGTYFYLWSDLSSEPEKYYSEQGDYWLRIEDNKACVDTVFFSITFDYFKDSIDLGSDTSLCAGNTLKLKKGENLCSSFLWSPSGNTNSSEIVNETGWYKLEVYNENSCYARDSIFVNIIGTAPSINYSVENLCFGDTTVFYDNSSPSPDILSWKWIINENDTIFSQNAEYVFSDIGQQNIQLFIKTSGCDNNLDFSVNIKPKAQISFTALPSCSGIENQFISSVNIPSFTNVSSYSWQMNNIKIGTEVNLSYLFPSVGDYNLNFELVLDNGCVSSYDSIINVQNSYPLPEYFSAIFPKNNYLLSSDSQKIDFTWNFPPDAKFFKLQFSDTQNFSNILYETENIFNNTYSYDLSLLPIDSIFWRIQAYNFCEDFATSNTYLIYKFSPTNLSNLALWLRADSVEIIDGKVVRWYDLSSNEHIIQQTNPEYRPIKIISELNSQPSVYFNGTNNYFDGGNILNIGYASQTMFVIAKSEKNRGSILSKTLTGPTANRYGLLFSDNISFFFWDNTERRIATDLIMNKFLYLNTIVDKQINKIFFNVNNDYIGEKIIAANYDMTSTYNFLIGASANNTGGLPPYNTSYFQGEISEILIFDTVLSSKDFTLVENYLLSKYIPPVNLGADINIPYGLCPQTLKTKNSYTSYLWSTGETTDSITVNKSGEYWIKTVDIFGKTSYDTINVKYQYKPIPDTFLCIDDTINIPSGLDNTYSFLWSNGDTNNVATVFTPGKWWVDITDKSSNLCSIRDSFVVAIDSFPAKATLGQDTSLCSGNSISLVSGVEPDINYLWSTGSTENSAIVSSAGNYWVSATNKNNCVLKDTINVSIKGIKPTVAFTATTSCQNEQTLFTDMSFTQLPDNIATWQWDFDNQGFSVLQNPSFKFNSHGDYNVKLVVSSVNGCIGDTTITVHVRSLPEVDFSPINGCNNKSIEFKDQSKIGEGPLFSWQWSFGDGQTSNTQNPTYTYLDTGLYTIKLIAQDIFGCKDSLEKNIKIKLSPKTTFEFKNGCIEQPINFYETTCMPVWAKIINRKWEFGDGSYSWSKNPTHIYNSSGEYTVTLKNYSINGCMDSISKNIIIQKTPTANFSTGNTCEGQYVQFEDQSFVENGSIVKWLWDFGNKHTDSISNPKIIYPDTGTYNVKLSVFSEFECKKTISKDITIHPITPNDFSFTPEYGIHPLSVQFTNLSEGNLTHQWFFGDGTSSTETNPSHTFINENIYDVLLVSKNEFNCVDSAFGIVFVIPSKLDLVLAKMNVKDSLNSIYIDALFFNNGTRNIRQIALDAKINNGLPLREVWNGLIKPGEYGYYKFVSSFPKVNESSIRMICLTISALDAIGQEDIDLQNNSACYTLSDDFFAEQVMPNPAKESIYTDIALPISGNIIASIISLEGKEIWKESIDSEAGILRLKIDISSFTDGIYVLKIQYKDKAEFFKFVKVSH